MIKLLSGFSFFKYINVACMRVWVRLLCICDFIFVGTSSIIQMFHCYLGLIIYLHVRAKGVQA